MTSPSERLHLHLHTWLGCWPGARPVDVVGAIARERPGWDGRIFPAVGVRSPESGVLSVRPSAADTVRATLERSTVDFESAWTALLRRLPALLGMPDRRVYSGVFRWCERPADLPDAGVWVNAADPSVPEWLKPFGGAEQHRPSGGAEQHRLSGGADQHRPSGGEVLIAHHPETGAYIAGVGIKRHDTYGQEIAVGTEPAARGRGLARALVAQAARRILDEGGVPTYQHDLANLASARVADAAGFPDRGWRSAGMP